MVFTQPDLVETQIIDQAAYLDVLLQRRVRADRWIVEWRQRATKRL
jgi:hypothetical protein